MPLLKRELAKHARGPVSSEEEWWHLVFDTDKKRLYVEHTWDRVDVRKGGPADAGTIEIDLDAFLTCPDQSTAHQELVRLLTMLVAKESYP